MAQATSILNEGEERELTGWGLRNASRSRVITPSGVDDLARALAVADRERLPVCLRAGGACYGDAAVLDGGVTLDSTALDRILSWDPATGVATVEPGVTIAQLWRRILPDGWRPPVVPGRGGVTMAGAAAANIHGKSSFRLGSFGDHVLSFELALPSGERVTCSRQERPELFATAISGMGLLGAFTCITLQARRVASGLVAQRQTAHSSLSALMAALDLGSESVDEMVAWVDTSARGPSLGRGLLSEARELAPGEDPHASETLRSAWEQWPALPGRLMQHLPSGLVPAMARPLTHPAGVWFANRAQWALGGRSSSHTWRRMSYPAANFPLDVVPNWREAYRPGGLIQHQAFVPAAAARQAFTAMLTRAHAAGHPPSLGVLKKERAGDFTLSYLVDGYSLALDFPILLRSEASALKLLRELNEITIEYGGRIYFAKDSTLTGEQVARMLPRESLQRFADVKHAVDPNETLQTGLYRRALRPALP